MASDGHAANRQIFKDFHYRSRPPTKPMRSASSPRWPKAARCKCRSAKTFWSPCFGMVADRFGVRRGWSPLHRKISRHEINLICIKFTPIMWFDEQSRRGSECYAAIFPNSKIVSMMRSGEAGPGPKGSVISATFELQGQAFIAFNGGPMFTFATAKRSCDCETHEEIGNIWAKLLPGEAKSSTMRSALKTDSACRGKSCRPSWVNCCKTRMPRNRSEL